MDVKKAVNSLKRAKTADLSMRRGIVLVVQVAAEWRFVSLCSTVRWKGLNSTLQNLLSNLVRHVPIPGQVGKDNHILNK